MSDDPAKMAAQARRCRRLANLSSGSVKTALLKLAEDYQRREEAARDTAPPPLRGKLWPTARK